MNVQKPEAQFVGIKNDEGLAINQPNAFHGISALFNNPVSTKDKAFVIQYEVKAQKPQECGGAYVKMLSDKEDLDVKQLDGQTPYTIMFGPDRCGADNDRVHFIFRHKNPKTGEYEEKHVESPPATKSDSLTHLYTLHIKPDNTFEMMIDMNVEKAGSLLKDFLPPVNPPKMIDDPTDKKPADWVDNEFMDDPEAVKPDDWDEDAPRKIPDPNATKPANWLDDEEEMIPDPKAVKPEDWDDEDDGEWEAPLVENEKCFSQGCGEWKPPMINNPDYKGKWSPPQIKNPDYKGEWKPKQIPNPHYFEDLNPLSSLDPMRALALELWNVNDGYLFDNFFVGDNIEHARKWAEDTWRVKYSREKAKQAKADAEQLGASGILSGISEAFQRMYAQVAEWGNENPTQAIVAAVMGLLPILLFCLWPSSKDEEEETNTKKSKSKKTVIKKKEKKEDDKEEDKEEEEDEQEEDKVKEGVAGTEGELEASSKPNVTDAKKRSKKKAKRAD
eukprot:TRINITY_DN737_c0_g1_i4.p1 TRINITY_DN737_c0_g1~~TRINITY_DN737_c0_g1_i4.p1  ORF type:complete len:501 (+),score=240.69 TRINITY_DN737_c0_g1_i4:1639-3141(+)